jgi:16S rRNA U1498 N3-methylase RsmE
MKCWKSFQKSIYCTSTKDKTFSSKENMRSHLCLAGPERGHSNVELSIFKRIVFWDVTLLSLIDYPRRF